MTPERWRQVTRVYGAALLDQPLAGAVASAAQDLSGRTLGPQTTAREIRTIKNFWSANAKDLTRPAA
jgi:hypothetical protein